MTMRRLISTVILAASLAFRIVSALPVASSSDGSKGGPVDAVFLRREGTDAPVDAVFLRREGADTPVDTVFLRQEGTDAPVDTVFLRRDGTDAPVDAVFLRGVSEPVVREVLNEGTRVDADWLKAAPA